MANHRAPGAHRVEHLSESGLDLAQRAIVEASARGSRGATARLEDGGVSSFATVERVAQHAAGWRVTDSSIDGITGAVLVMSGLPGRYQSHAV